MSKVDDFSPIDGDDDDHNACGGGEGQTIPTSSARSRCGGLGVVTTAQGLPLSVRIGDSHLAKRPEVLADDILRLCRQSAMAAGISMRAEMLASGVAPDVVEALGLPRADDLARIEAHDDQYDDAPASWLRSV